MNWFPSLHLPSCNKANQNQSRWSWFSKPKNKKKICSYLQIYLELKWLLWTLDVKTQYCEDYRITTNLNIYIVYYTILVHFNILPCFSFFTALATVKKYCYCFVYVTSNKDSNELNTKDKKLFLLKNRALYSMTTSFFLANGNNYWFHVSWLSILNILHFFCLDDYILLGINEGRGSQFLSYQ